MEELVNEEISEPKYTFKWLGSHVAFALAVTVFFSLLDLCVDSLALNRMRTGLLDESYEIMISDSLSYCFIMIGLSLLSVMLAEIACRRPITYFQYSLIGASLCLSYLLLLALSEVVPFVFAYIISSAMTIGLIMTFVYAMTSYRKALYMVGGFLTLEYALILVLVCIGAMALLVGSIALFAIIAITMYFTVKLRLENEELVLK